MAGDHGTQSKRAAAGSLFSDLLASSIHDMKNSLGLVLHSMDELAELDLGEGARPRVAGLQQETRRIRNQLIQLLSLYKLEDGALELNARVQPLEDFLEDCLLRDGPLLDACSTEASFDCPTDLQWCFDADLTAGVIANAVHNAVRHAGARISLAAETRQDWLRLSVNDDGGGFPTAMTGPVKARPGSIDIDHGGTGLGLRFAAIAAGLHRRAGRTGYATLENGGALGGGVFAVYLP